MLVGRLAAEGKRDEAEAREREVREILKLLFTINAAATAVIMATHDHEMVRRYGRRIVHLEKGEIVKDEQAFGGLPPRPVPAPAPAEDRVQK